MPHIRSRSSRLWNDALPLIAVFGASGGRADDIDEAFRWRLIGSDGGDWATSMERCASVDLIITLSWSRWITGLLLLFEISDRLSLLDVHGAITVRYLTSHIAALHRVLNSRLGTNLFGIKLATSTPRDSTRIITQIRNSHRTTIFLRDISLFVQVSYESIVTT